MIKSWEGLMLMFLNAYANRENSTKAKRIGRKQKRTRCPRIGRGRLHASKYWRQAMIRTEEPAKKNGRKGFQFFLGLRRFQRE